jgi:hypothetical protein
MVELMLATRREQFPKRINAGQLSPDEAARELSAFEDLLADWLFICSGEGAPANASSLPARRDVLDQAIIRIATFASQNSGFSDQLFEQANRVIALRWHCEPGRQTIAMARLTHELRADARPKRKAPDHE